MDKTLRAGVASRALRLCVAAIAGASSFQSMHVLAGPTGARIVAGAGSVSGAGGGTHTNTIVRQTSSRLAIDWNSFSTQSNESITFNQPNANAIALNRVVGQSPSILLGTLNANGQVFVVNPRGVLFGPGAQVNVGGLLATTLGISDGDFMSGHYAFSGTDARGRGRWSDRDGAIVNRGNIQSAPGGYVALIGARVINDGAIAAPGGTVALAAGQRVSVTLGDHSLIGFAIDQGAWRALAANHGLIVADGGQAWLAAKGEDALFSSVVNNTGVVRAQTVTNQNGVIRLVADDGVALVGGTLDASAPLGGGGGVVETSGAQVRVANDARITTAAASGQTGIWRISSDFLAMVGGPRFFSTMSAATLSNALDTTNVALSVNGYALIDGPVAWRGANTLSIAATRDIAIDAPIDAANGTLALNALGAATQRAPIVAAGLALEGASGQYVLTNAANRIGTVAANARAVALTDSAPLDVGGVAGVRGITSNDAVTLVAPSVTLDAPVSSRAGGTAVTIASNAFDNRAGPNALATPNGRWIVYSDSPDSDAFGGLQSGNLALWGDAYSGATDARASASAGNRFAFNAVQQITLTAVNIDKPPDTARTLGPNDVTIALRYDGTRYGGAFADSPSVHEPFVFIVTSTGATPGAASGSYVITITAVGGPAGYRITTQSGTLRVASVAPDVPVSPLSPVSPVAPLIPVTPDTPAAPSAPTQPIAALPAILDSVRTDATDPHLGDMQPPGMPPTSTPLVQTRTDSSSDGSRLPDDAWPGRVCRM